MTFKLLYQHIRNVVYTGIITINNNILSFTRDNSNPHQQQRITIMIMTINITLLNSLYTNGVEEGEGVYIQVGGGRGSREGRGGWRKDSKQQTRLKTPPD